MEPCDGAASFNHSSISGELFALYIWKPPFGYENLWDVQFVLLFLDAPQNSSEHLSVFQNELPLTPQSCLCRCPAEAEEGEIKDNLRSGQLELARAAGGMDEWVVSVS